MRISRLLFAPLVALAIQPALVHATDCSVVAGASRCGPVVGSRFPFLSTPSLPNLRMSASDLDELCLSLQVKETLSGQREGRGPVPREDSYFLRPGDLRSSDYRLSETSSGWGAYAQEDVFGERNHNRHRESIPQIIPPADDPGSYLDALDTAEYDWLPRADPARID